VVDVRRGTCPTTGGIDVGVTAADMATWTAMVRDEIVPAARRAAQSDAFRQCVRQLMTTSNTTMPHEPQPNGWGPYCWPGDPACLTAGDTDPYNHLVSGLPTARIRALMAERAIAHAQTPNVPYVECVGGANAPANPGTGAIDANRSAPEGTLLYPRYINDQVNVRRNGTAAQIAGDRGFTAAIIWHEVMHNHRYRHCHQPDEATCAPMMIPEKQIPHIIGACIRDVIQRTFDNNCATRVTCSQPGTYPVISTFKGTSCGCVSDPGEPQQHAFTNRWTFSGGLIPSVVADSSGNAWMTRGVPGRVHRLVGTSWVNQNVEGKLFAGGDTVVLQQGTSLWRRNPSTSDTWQDVGSAGNEIALDDIGTIYRRTTSGVEQLRLASATWENVGGPASKLVVGGDALFALSPANGDIWRFSRTGLTAGNWSKAGGPGAWFDVDAFGVLYGLATNNSAIFRNTGGSNWESFAGPASFFVTADRFYLQNSGTRTVRRRYPSGPEQIQSTTCNWFAAGGRDLYCVSDTGSGTSAIERYGR
jgi:hypothetical protein